MGNIGDSFATTNPSVGDAGTGYATAVKAILAEVMARLSAQVPLSSLAAGATGETVDLNNIGLLNAQYLQMYAQSGAPSGAPFARLASFAGNLYYVDTAGAVKITDGASLNSAALAGFTGDYGGVNPAAAEFVDVSETYIFWDNAAAGQYAIVKAKQFDVTDETLGRTTSILPSPSIAASYNFVLPPAPPAAGQVSVLAMDENGVVNLAENIDPVTRQFSMTGGILHNDHLEWHAIQDYDYNIIAGAPTISTTLGKLTSAAVFTVNIFFSIPQGRRLKSFSARGFQSAGSTMTVTLARIDDGTATNITIDAGNSSVVVGAAITVSAVVTTPAALATAARIYRASIGFTGGGAGTYDIYAVVPTYDYV